MPNKSKISTGIIILLITLFLLLIASIVFLVIIDKNLNECRNTESLGCPSYLCSYNPISNTGGTPCAILNQEIGKDGSIIAGGLVPFRYDKKNQIQCQNYTLNNNRVIPTLQFNCNAGINCTQV